VGRDKEKEGEEAGQRSDGWKREREREREREWERGKSARNLSDGAF
jgi:hypothetical protein